MNLVFTNAEAERCLNSLAARNNLKEFQIRKHWNYYIFQADRWRDEIRCCICNREISTSLSSLYQQMIDLDKHARDHLKEYGLIVFI